MNNVDYLLHGCEAKYIMTNIQAVLMNMSWIRKIHVIVTPEIEHMTPLLGNIIDMSRKIRLVHISDFVPSEYLGSFKNSCVVESWVWRINGLSDKFVYACNDMFVNKPTSINHFFVGNHPIVRMDTGPADYSACDTDKLLNHPIPYAQMFGNAIVNHGIHYTRLSHNMQPFRKSLLKKYFEEYRSVVMEASNNTERSGKLDFNLLRIGSSLSIMKGDALARVGTEDFFCESNDPMCIQSLINTL